MEGRWLQPPEWLLQRSREPLLSLWRQLKLAAQHPRIVKNFAALRSQCQSKWQEPASQLPLRLPFGWQTWSRHVAAG